MAERALTEEAVQAGLHDIRLPASAPGGVAAELLAAAGVGLLLALAVAALLMLVTRVRRASVTTRPAQEAVAGGNAAERALLIRLKRERPERFAEISGALYRPGGLPDARTLETMLEAP